MENFDLIWWVIFKPFIELKDPEYFGYLKTNTKFGSWTNFLEPLLGSGNLIVTCESKFLYLNRGISIRVGQ